MGSVVNTWSVKCDNRKVQENLCNNLREIAELSHSYFKDITPVKYFDHTVKGRIIIDSDLFETPVECSHLERITQLSDSQKRSILGNILLSYIVAPLDATKEEIEEIIERDAPQPAEFFIAKEVNLHGLQFRLYDPRERYNLDCVGFVFVSMDSCPSINGLLVNVSGKEECSHSSYPLIREADLYLSKNEITVRNYCETWMGRLMMYVKYFYIPDLRYDDLREKYYGGPNYESFYSDYFGKFDKKDAGNKALNELKEDFKEEVRDMLSAIAADPNIKKVTTITLNISDKHAK